MKKDDDERRFPLIPDAGFGEARLGAGETGPLVGEFPSDRSSLRAALLQQEIECASGLPAFSSVAARIDAQPSALNAPRWPAGKSLRIAGSLAVSQLGVIPRVVIPSAVAVACVAVWLACFAPLLPDAVDPSWLFSALLLFGVAITVTLALSADRADVLLLATPLGPQAVMLARLAAVLFVDAVAGIAASAAFAFWGASVDFGGVVVSWLAPLAAVAGIASFVTVWTGASWAGAIVAAALVPAFAPVAHGTDAAGVVALIGSMQGALGPGGIAAIGVAVLAAVVCSARRAQLARLQLS